MAESFSLLQTLTFLLKCAKRPPIELATLPVLIKFSPLRESSLLVNQSHPIITTNVRRTNRMPTAAAGLFLVDFVIRPFFKIYEKMPLVMLLVCLVLYGIVAYFVLKSAFLADQQH